MTIDAVLGMILKTVAGAALVALMYAGIRVSLRVLNHLSKRMKALGM